MVTKSGWEAGEPCERHDLEYCADCLRLGRMRRSQSGDVRYRQDCTVQTFAEITGLEYDFAVEVLRSAGFIPGRGATGRQFIAAVESVGGKVTVATHLGESGAVMMSYATSARKFAMFGWKGSGASRSGHAWSVIDGEINRGYEPPYRYRIYEISGL